MHRRAYLTVLIGIGLYASESLGDDATRLTYLTPGVSDHYDHRGCTPNPTKVLAEFTAAAHPEFFVDYDIQKLLAAGVEPYYIYDRRYCAPVGRVLQANLFVMTRLNLVGVGPKGECVDDLYDVELKVFSSETQRERVVYRASRVSTQDLPRLFKGNEKGLLAEILAVAQQEGSAP
jgi:hypothetical protein